MSELTKKQWVVAAAVAGSILVGGVAFVSLRKSPEPAGESKGKDAKAKGKDKGKEKEKGKNAVPRLASFAGRAFGGSYTVRAVPPTPEAAKSMPNEVREIFAKLEAVLGATGADSAVRKVNEAKVGERVELPSELVEILSAVAEAHQLSGGAVDVTLHPLEVLFEGGKVPSAADVAKVKGGLGFEKLGFDAKDKSIKKKAEGVVLDLSSIAAAYAVDRVAAKFDQDGVENYSISVPSVVTRVHGEQGPKRPWALPVSYPVQGMRSALLGRVMAAEPTAIAMFVERSGDAPGNPEGAGAAKPGEPGKDPKVNALAAATRAQFAPDSLVDPRTLAPTTSEARAPRAFAGTALVARLRALAARRMTAEGALDFANKNQFALVAFVGEGDKSEPKKSAAFEKLSLQAPIAPPKSGERPPGVKPGIEPKK